MTLPVSLKNVLAARERIASHVHMTPVLTSRTLDRMMGARVFLKAEVFQRVGAFKVRGAFSRLTLLTAEERRRGVVGFSSGNHAQAVALAASELGIPATIVMPDDAPAMKLAATRGYGAEVILYSRSGEKGRERPSSREEIAGRIVAETGATLVPPFDDESVIAGQGTLGVEFLEQVPDLDVILAPCGGGGLLSGIALAARGIDKTIRILGVEPEAGDDMRQSMASGAPVTIPVPDTIADCLKTTRPGDRTFAILRELAEGILTVPDDSLRRAMAFCASRLKIVVEPGGAAALAALLDGSFSVPHPSRIGIVLSGGNIDPERFGDLVKGVSF